MANAARITPKNRRKISSPVLPIIFFKYLEATIATKVNSKMLTIAALTEITECSRLFCENNKIDNVNVPGPASSGIDIGKTEISESISVLREFHLLGDHHKRRIK